MTSCLLNFYRLGRLRGESGVIHFGDLESRG